MFSSSYIRVLENTLSASSLPRATNFNSITTPADKGPSLWGRDWKVWLNWLDTVVWRINECYLLLGIRPHLSHILYEIWFSQT